MQSHRSDCGYSCGSWGLENVENLPSEEKERIFHFMDLVIRDTKAKKAYAS